MKKNTEIINAGRARSFTGAAVNPKLVRTSTVVFESVAQMHEAAQRRDDGVEYYGRRGTSTTFALTQAMCDLEHAAGSYVYSCGTAAITACLLSFLRTGDHVLMVDSVYEPTRDFVNGTLGRMGISATYYDPLIGANINDLIQVNTKVIFLESPGSWTMEVQDLPAITRVAKEHGIVTMIDNTYATPLYFKPLDFGVDISIHSATKYLNGHSDVMLGIASATEGTWRQLQRNSYELGHCASVDDCYTTLRGLRTLPVRMQQHQHSALAIATWLSSHPMVEEVRHPALASCPGNDVFARDFAGSSGLFSFTLRAGNRAALTAMLDSLKHFKLGFSWGGYESLVLGTFEAALVRDQPSLVAQTGISARPIVRVHIGLEDIEDLRHDLACGLDVYNAHL